MPTNKIRVNLKKTLDKSYNILIDHGHFEKTILQEIKRISPSKISVITDSNLVTHYKDFIAQILDKAEVDFQIVAFEAGEKNKNISTIMELFSGLSDFGMDRKSLVIAIGGGVCGDMAGFLSSIYLRGIPFIQVPTSILSMVDSSVGGKTGVDTPAGKNLAGAFYQPASVIIDTHFLDTLAQQEFINGMAEVIKHTLINDLDTFHWLNDNKSNILKKQKDVIIKMITISCAQKAAVVEQDEKEAGLRQTLNLGHTFGHAIEHASQFKIPHGYAISLGTIAAAHVSLHRAGLTIKDYQAVIDIYKEFGLLEYLDLFKKLDPLKVRKAASSDKKNVLGKVKIVLLTGIGSVKQESGVYSFTVDDKEFKGALDAVASIV